MWFCKREKVKVPIYKDIPLYCVLAELTLTDGSKQEVVQYTNIYRQWSEYYIYSNLEKIKDNILHPGIQSIDYMSGRITTQDHVGLMAPDGREISIKTSNIERVEILDVINYDHIHLHVDNHYV